MNFTLFTGDCLEYLASMQDRSIDLVYVDPPFFTQRVHSLTSRCGSAAFSFDDIWESIEEYGTFIRERLYELHRVLKDTGSLFFHCNRNSTHLVRFALDQIFGVDQFRSEIIWTYRRWSNSNKGLLPSHQTILFFSKTGSFKFNQIYTDYSPATNTDQIMQRRARDSRGKSVYQRDSSGKIVSSGGKKGVPLGDVWDIPYLNPKAQERVGYPTQKPILLLERIIKLVTDAGDLVLDPFCGSGTALVAAHLLKRGCVGIDRSPDAITLARRRLDDPVRTASALLEKGRDSYTNADSFVNNAMHGIEFVRVHRNSGIDGILKSEIDGNPIFFRVQRKGETVSEVSSALKKAAKGKGEPILLVIITEDARDMFGDAKIAGIRYAASTALSVQHVLNSATGMNRTSSVDCSSNRFVDCRAVEGHDQPITAGLPSDQ
jgi:site-specific DNA-methyltransferase (adenine-specific)